MDMERRDDNEPLIEGMNALPDGAFDVPKCSPELRESILTQTISIVRARSRRRRLAILAVVASAYILGITTAYLFIGSSMLKGDEATAKSPYVEEKERTVDPAELVKLSESAAPDEKIHLLKQAGDLFLSEQYDVEGALDCYRRALDKLPPPQQTRVEPDDSWLLAVLKDSRKY